MHGVQVKLVILGARKVVGPTKIPAARQLVSDPGMQFIKLQLAEAIVLGFPGSRHPAMIRIPAVLSFWSCVFKTLCAQGQLLRFLNLMFLVATQPTGSKTHAKAMSLESRQGRPFL